MNGLASSLAVKTSRKTMFSRHENTTPPRAIHASPPLCLTAVQLPPEVSPPFELPWPARIAIDWPWPGRLRGRERKGVIQREKKREGERRRRDSERERRGELLEFSPEEEKVMERGSRRRGRRKEKGGVG